MSERSHIAGLLQEARERRGLTAEAAASESGIPLRYLQLLEGETPAVGVADEFYLIPFFRRYTAFVGLDAEKLLPEFLGDVQHVPAEPPAQAPLALGRPFPFSIDNLWKPTATFLAVALATFLMLRNAPDPVAANPAGARPGAEPVEEAAAPAPPVAVPEERIADAGNAPRPDAADARPAVLAAAPGPRTGTASPFDVPAPAGRELHVLATEQVWLEIGRDGDPPEEFWLEPGDTHSWTATESFTLKVGNAGGVSLAFDGRKLPPLGDSGQVVRLRLPPPEEAEAGAG